MKSKQEKQAERLSRQLEKETQNINQKTSKQSQADQSLISILWNKLNHQLEPDFELATNEVNAAYINKQAVYKDLSSYANGFNYASIATVVVIVIAAIMDAFLWQKAFQDMDGLNSQKLARAIGLTVAIFGTICCAGLGRAIKERSTLDNSKYTYNKTQQAVFDKNTKHNTFWWFMIPLAICAITIPIVRASTTNEIMPVVVLTGISYFIFAAVTAFEALVYCVWTKEIKRSDSLYSSKKANHKKLVKQCNAIGAKLAKIKNNSNDKFNNFMKQSKFQLITDQVYTLPKPTENNKTFIEQQN